MLKYDFRHYIVKFLNINVLFNFTENNKSNTSDLMKNKTLKTLLVIAGIIVIIIILLPGIAKRYVINHSKELAGRQIHLEKLKVNYFTGTIKAIDFRMLEKNERENFIVFDTLIINLEPLQLFRDKIEIEEFYLKGLDVKVSMKDSIFNYDDLIAFHSVDEDSINQKGEDNPLKYSISNLELKDASFHFNDQNIKHITDLKNISFLVPFIGWNQEDKSNADVKFNFENGGYIESILNLNPINGEYDANIIVDDLKLNSFYKYVAKYAEINDFDGLVDSNLHIIGNTNNPMESIVSGKFKVNDFKMTDKTDKNFLGANEIEADFNKLDFNNSNFILDTLKINNSYTYFKLDSLTNNFSRIFRLNETKETDSISKQEESTDSLYYAIKHLDLNQGVLDYTDNLTGNSFNYHLSEITINTDSISSDANWIDIQSEMLLNNRGTLKAYLGLNPSDFNYANLDFTIENFLLSDINVYSNYYTGHSIIEGDMYYKSNSIVTNGNVESENSLTVKNVSLKNEEGGLYSLPLKFALFLLKDKNGNVKLDIPLTGKVSDPSFSVGKLVWGTFSTLIIKTATSPGRLLAGLVGAKTEDIEEIQFDYLDIEPKEKQAKILDKLLELEQKKEGLKIDLIYFINKQLQKEQIAKQEAGKLYFKETQKDYIEDIEGFEVFLHKKMALDSINKENLYWSIISRSKVDSIASSNTKLLLSNTEIYLLAKNDSTSIKISKSNIDTPENNVVFPTLRIEYSIEEDKNE